MVKTTANSIPTEMSWPSKATLQGKSKQKKNNVSEFTAAKMTQF